MILLGATLGLLLIGGAAAAQAQEPAHVLIYSGTVAHRHTDTINQGIGPIQDALDDANITYDWENCGEIAAIPGCHEPNQNERIFTDENLAQYDAIFLFNAGGNTPQPLFTQSDREAIQNFVNAGGGIAANHLATDMGAGQVSWGWWDGDGNTALGTQMPAHPAAPQTATAHVSDRNHPSTRDLPDTIQHSDEHYSFYRSVRGTHHVLVTLDETSYDPLAEPHGGGNPPAVAMGADHPISWCRLYDGGRIWATSMGHFANLYTANGGDNYLIDHLVGGVQWAAGVEGTEGDCGGTVWSNFQRTILSTDVQGPIGLDIADDGTVYWTEIGLQGMESEGRLKMWDPDSGETTVVEVIPTRADALSTSEDGVLGMELDPDFETNRRLYIYYSPRGEDEGWPVAGTGHALGYNRLSRFTLNAEGTAVIDEQPILDVPKVKVATDGDGIGNPGSPNWPAHTGGAGLDFDSEGNLYLGVGDDVNPFGTGQNGYAPMDQQYEHRYDARNTSANTNDLRGKVLRIDPLADIEPGTEPGIGQTYAIPTGNMFPVGTPNTRPEIYAMGFRQPFTVQADPADPGTIVVGEYGPDSGTNNANRGPAGIVEWNHITEPGFFGWPFCTGDNSNANAYNRYTYPSGPSGERYDCSQPTVPNESDFNTGLDDVPGPPEPADVWHKRTGEHPPEFGIPMQGAPQEAITGPIYRFDAENPSETKWPAYFDGSWLILDRGQNWWREARITDDGQELLKVNAFFQPNQFGTPGHTSVIPVKFGPDGSLYLARFTGRGSSAQLMRIDYVGGQEDEEPPTVAATVDGPQNDDGDFVARATLEISASDGEGSGVERIEYSVNGGEPVEAENGDFSEPFVFSQLFDEPGEYEVTFQAFDRSGNESDEGQISFTVVDGSNCTFLRSDEFTASEIDTDKWTVRVDEPGFEATIEDGALVLPVLDEVDGDRTAPLSFVSQQVPDGEWSVTTRLTIDHETNWQQAGLMLWQSDGNFIKAGFTADGPNPDQRRFELTADDPVDVRHFSPSLNVDADFPTTVWIRLFREGDLIGVDAAPDNSGDPGAWTRLAGARAVSGDDEGNEIDPPREGPGVMVGPYAGGHLDGPWTNTAAFDFVRFDPDEIECEPGGNNPPVIDAMAADPTSGEAPLEVSFSVSASDPDGDGLSYEWDFGDGESSSEEDPTHTYAGPGEYEAEVTVSDGELSVSDSVTVTVTEPPIGEPELTLRAKPRVVKVGPRKKLAKLRFLATNTGDAPTGPINLCVKAPKRKLALKGRKCLARPSLDPGQTTQRPVRLRVKPKARGKTTAVKLIARGPGVPNERIVARVRAKG
ncbi:MAG TPA: ThuA domain-containing protein [Solirubrobacterales bacterium]|nr:ThuA domain-containing protein [Solirubrobacterales bacterium]